MKVLLQKPASREFLLFTLVGALATATQYLVLVVLVETTPLNAVYASSLGYVCGALVNYSLNRKHTFKSTKAHRKALIQFITIFLIGFALNALLMTMTAEILHFQYIFAQITSTAAVFFWNFLAHRRWTFRDPIISK